MLVAFEKVEAARWLQYLKKGGTLVVNDFEIYSLPVLTGAAEYPHGVTEKLKAAVPNTKAFNAGEIASGSATSRRRTSCCSARSSRRWGSRISTGIPSSKS